MIEERAELDLAVAQHVGIRRSPGRVVVKKMREHALAIFGSEIDRVELDANDVGDGGRIDEVLA